MSVNYDNAEDDRRSDTSGFEEEEEEELWDDDLVPPSGVCGCLGGTDFSMCGVTSAAHDGTARADAPPGEPTVVRSDDGGAAPVRESDGVRIRSGTDVRDHKRRRIDTAGNNSTDAVDPRAVLRRVVLGHVAALRREHPGDGTPFRPCGLVFDDDLGGNPDRVPRPRRGKHRNAVRRRLFVEELRAALPDCDLRRVYSPNVRADVVERSAALGVGRAERDFGCEFIDRHAAEVRSVGGFRPGRCHRGGRRTGGG